MMAPFYPTQHPESRCAVRTTSLTESDPLLSGYWEGSRGVGGRALKGKASFPQLPDKTSADVERLNM